MDSRQSSHLKVPQSRMSTIRHVPTLMWTKFSDSQLEEIVRDEKLISADSKCIRSKVDLARLCERRLEQSHYSKWMGVFRENSGGIAPGNRGAPADLAARRGQQKVVESETPPRKAEGVSLDHVEQNILESMQMLSTSMRCQTKPRHLPEGQDFKNTPLAPSMEEMNDFEDDLNEASLTPLLVFKPGKKPEEPASLDVAAATGRHRFSAQRASGVRVPRSSAPATPAVPSSAQITGSSRMSVPRMRAPTPLVPSQPRLPPNAVDPKNTSYEDELMVRTTSCSSVLAPESRVTTDVVLSSSQQRAGDEPGGSRMAWGRWRWAVLVCSFVSVAGGLCLRDWRTGKSQVIDWDGNLPFFCGLDWMEPGCTKCPQGAQCTGGMAACGSFERLEKVGEEWSCASYEKELEKVLNDGLSRVTAYLRSVETVAVSCGEPAEEEGFVDVLWLFDEFVSVGSTQEMRSDLMKLFMTRILSVKTLTKLSLMKSRGSELKIKSVKSQFRAMCRVRKSLHSWALVVGGLFACLCCRAVLLCYIDHHRKTAIVKYIQRQTFIDKNEYASGPLLEDVQTWCHNNKYPRAVGALLSAHDDIVKTKLRNNSQPSFFSASKALELRVCGQPPL